MKKPSGVGSSRVRRPPLISNLGEIFSSYQGEGIYAGVKQIFIRFAICNLNCRYCDTSKYRTTGCYYRVEDPPFSKHFNTFKNPAGVKDIISVVEANMQHQKYHSISITGGEPLCQSNFLEVLLQILRRSSLPIYLNTNGTMPKNLSQIINYVDIIALDIKLPSTAKVNIRWANTRRFIRIARAKNVFIKLVITNDVDIGEIKKVVKSIRNTDKNIPVVLQPVTSMTKHILTPDNTLLMKISRLFEVRGIKTHIIPQLHKKANWC